MRAARKQLRIVTPSPSRRSRPDDTALLGRFVRDIQPAPVVSPEVKEDPWKISRPNMTLPDKGDAPLLSTLLRAVEITYRFLLFFLYAGYVRLTVPGPFTRQRLKAKRLRESVEELHGMFVKMGQQLSLRMDLLPKVYCDELSSLLDRSPVFDYRSALKAIEEQIGKPWSEVFAEINPNPIGSASIACVYDAHLLSGERVAIKVRRPGIVKVFATDLRALRWAVSFFEFLCLMRPGLLSNFQDELREMFLEELDFRVEARYQELFRRYLKKRRYLHVTAPRVYYRLSGVQVLVMEFVVGEKMTSIQNAVAGNDEAYLAYLKELGICPKLLAKRLIRASYYTFYECPFFHGDPHPANIYVQPGSKIIMLDFGACGVFSAKDRAWMWQMQEFYTRGDVAGMVQCVLGLMEPLYLMDVDSFKNDLLQAWWHGYYGIKSKHAAWWERTSFRLWLALLELFRKYQLPMPHNLLRMIRATLLYDTVAAQLYPRINVFKEFRKYYDRAVRKSKERLIRSLLCQLVTGPTPENCFIIEQAIQTGKDLLFRTQQFLRRTDLNFIEIPDKIFGLIDSVVMFFRSSLMATLIGVAVLLLTWYSEGAPNVGFNPLHWDLKMRTEFVLLLVVYLVFTYLYSKRVMFRFRDPDNYNDRRGT